MSLTDLWKRTPSAPPSPEKVGTVAEVDEKVEPVRIQANDADRSVQAVNVENGKAGTLTLAITFKNENGAIAFQSALRQYFNDYKAGESKGAKLGPHQAKRDANALTVSGDLTSTFGLLEKMLSAENFAKLPPLKPAPEATPGRFRLFGGRGG